MTKLIHGIIHGKTIELAEDPGIPPGQEIEVVLKLAPGKGKTKAWGEGLQRCAGLLAKDWSDRDDKILAEIYRDRQIDSRPEIAE